MSEPEVGAPSPEAPPPPARRRGRLRRWTRRLGCACIVLVVLAIALRIAMPALAPAIATRVAPHFGLAVEFGGLDLTLHRGRAIVIDFVARPLVAEGAPPADPILRLDHALVDVDMRALFGAHLRVERAEVDGLELVVLRRADGSFQFTELIPKGDTDEEPEPEEPKEPGPLDLELPIEIDDLRAQGVVLVYRDESGAEPVELRLRAGLRADDFGAPGRPGTLDGWVAGRPLLDLARVRMRVESDGPRARVEVLAELNGLRPGAFEPVLEPLGLRARAQSLSGQVKLDLGVEPLDPAGEDLRVELALTESMLEADGVECLALDEARAIVSPLNSGRATIEDVSVRGGRVRAGRAADGAFGLAGIELFDAKRMTAASTASPAAGAPGLEGEDEARPTSPEPAPSFVVTGLERLSLDELGFVFSDEWAPLPEPIELQLERLRLDGLAFQPAVGDPPAGLRAVLKAPGLIEESVLEGALQVLGPELGADLVLDVRGIEPDRVRPYLALLGIETTLRNASFGGRLKASWSEVAGGGARGGLALTGIQLSDGAELAAVDRLAVEDVSFDSTGGLRLGEIAAEGTRLVVRRAPEGRIEALGLRFGGEARAPAGAASASPGDAAPESEPEAPEAPPDAAAAAAPPSSTHVDASPLRVELGRVHWGGVELHLIDETLEHPLDLRVTDLAFDLEQLVVGGDPSGPRPPPAKLSFRTGAAGIADELSVDGTLQGGHGVALDAELDVTGRGITLAALAPFLSDFGLDVRLVGAELALRVAGGLRLEDGALHAGLELSGASWSDAGVELGGLGALALRELVVSKSGLSVGELALLRPRLRVGRDADGALELLGLRIPPAPPAEPAPSAPQGATAGPSALERLLNEPLALPAVSIGRFAVDDASIAWRDALVDPPLEAELRARGELAELELGAARPARFEWVVGSPGTLGSLALEGELVPDPEHLRAHGRVDLAGLRNGPLARYLPPSASVALEDGRMALAFDARWEAAAEGGRALRLEVNELAYRDGEQGAPLLAFQRFAIAASRLDARARVYTLDEVALAGFELDARRTASGFELLGLTLGSPPAEAAPIEAAAPAVDSPPAPAPPAKASAWKALRFDAGEVPTARIEAFSLELAHLRYVDETRADAEPFDLALRLSTPGALVLISPDYADLPPLELRLEGRALPIASSIEATLGCSPYVDQPDLQAAWHVGGMRGAGLVEVVPQLASFVDGSSLDEAQLSGQLAGSLRWRRRSPADFDLSSGFGADLRFTELALRTGADGEDAAGIDAISIQVQRINPSTGDVYVRSIDVDRPYARVARDERGVHAFGLTLLPPPPAAVEPSAETVEAPQPEAAATPEDLAALPQLEPPPAAEDGAPLRSKPEVRVDRLRVTGLDFEFRDTTVDPPLVYPLIDLDLVVDRFTTRAFEEEHAIGFRADLVGGGVELPEHTAESSLLGGLFGAATSMLRIEGERALEERPVFDEVSAAGRLAFYPAPSGWVRVRVREFELLPFRTAAVKQGIEVKDGLMSTRVDARLDENVLHVDTRTTFQSLSLSEPVGGPISSVLKLPAPLDTVLFVLQNDRGEQVVPVGFELDASKGLSSEQVVSAATGALIQVISSAITSSPKRVLGNVTELPVLHQVTSFLGRVPGLKWIFGEDEAAAFAGRRFEVMFEPGVTAPPQFELARLEPLIEALRDNDELGVVISHDLGGGDVTRAAVLANPTPDQCRSLTMRLRQRRAEVLARRSELAGELGALYAAGRESAAEAPHAALRELDADLGETEEALDRMYEFLAPGAERRADRRTREAATVIGAERLEGLRRELVRLAGDEVAERIELRPPRFRRAQGEGGGTARIVAVLLR